MNKNYRSLAGVLGASTYYVTRMWNEWGSREEVERWRGKGEMRRVTGVGGIRKAMGGARGDKEVV